ncbi:MAG: hypothetical protein MK033_00605 [Candidatus Caenarcaniphilales bacterium]|nr:hypothetical protein [Candidatus Caenarcaniphilales bacterium]
MKHLGSEYAKAVMASVDSYESKLTGSVSVIQDHFNCESKEELVDTLFFSENLYRSSKPNSKKLYEDQYIDLILEHSAKSTYADPLDTLKGFLDRDDKEAVIAEIENIDNDKQNESLSLYQSLLKTYRENPYAYKTYKFTKDSHLAIRGGAVKESDLFLEEEKTGRYILIQDKGENYIIFSDQLGVTKASDGTKGLLRALDGDMSSYDSTLEKLMGFEVRALPLIQESIVEPGKIDLENGKLLAHPKIDVNLFESRFQDLVASKKTGIEDANIDDSNKSSNLYLELRNKIISGELASENMQVLFAWDASGKKSSRTYQSDSKGKYQSVKVDNRNYILVSDQQPLNNLLSFFEFDESNSEQQSQSERFEQIIARFTKTSDGSRKLKQAILESLTVPAEIDNNGKMISSARIDLDLLESKLSS